MTQLSAVSQSSGLAIDPINAFQPLALRAMFWRPAYLESSAWLEHIPFAFWLVEAHQPRVVVELGSHYGTSYFAFCQAVDRLGLDTQCFAVDTWKGDEQTGLYDETVFEKVKTHNEAQYCGFSRLVRSSFDDAVRQFSDGSIDLLHIDGQHTLDAVRHDFDNWLPKLSKRGVIVMHGTNRRERGFGVYKLFEQLQTQYPSFEFVHGHGLAVLGIGPEQSDLLADLFKSNENESAKRAIHEVFSRLGRACADSLSAVQQQELSRKLTEEVDKQKKQLEEFKQSMDKTKADLSTRSKELTETRSRMQTLVEHHAVERGQLAERTTLLQEIRTELKEEVARLQARIDATTAEMNQRVQDLARLEQTSQSLQLRVAEREAELASYRQQVAAIGAELQERGRALEKLRDDAEKSRSEIRSLEERLAEQEAELEESRCERRAQAEEISKLQEEKSLLEQSNAAHQQKLDNEVASLGVQLLTTQEELATLRQVQAKAKEQSQEKLKRQEAQTQQLAREKAALQADKDNLSRKVEDRFKELAKLTSMLELADKARKKSEEECAEVKGQLVAIEQAYAQKTGTQNVMHERPASGKWATPLRLFRGSAEKRDKEKAERKFAQQAQLLRQSGLFDEAWYLARNPDVRQSKVNPVQHYLRFGAAEGRDPGPAFSTKAYTLAYPDVAASRINPLMHYVSHGRKEGRTVHAVKEQ
jgi:chromosome segregation ATPase